MRVASQSTSAPRFSATVKAPKAAPAPTPAPKRLSNAVNTLAAGIVTLSTIFAGLQFPPTRTFPPCSTNSKQNKHLS